MNMFVGSFSSFPDQLFRASQLCSVKAYLLDSTFDGDGGKGRGSWWDCSRRVGLKRIYVGYNFGACCRGDGREYEI